MAKVHHNPVTVHDFKARTSSRTGNVAHYVEPSASPSCPFAKMPSDCWQQLYLGLAVQRQADSIIIGYCTHDGTYSTDFALHAISTGSDYARDLAGSIVAQIRLYSMKHNDTFLGAGVTHETVDICPLLPSLMWKELDLVTMVFDKQDEENGVPREPTMDELADSMARKCVMMFGPCRAPRVQVGFRNIVLVDAAGHAVMTNLDEYRKTVGERTWDATQFYAQRLRARGTRIAFFSSTPQGGGVALMRHALVRFCRLLGIDLRWYVPQPRPAVFRITKTNHNMLQGVASPEDWLSDQQAKTLNDWSQSNADRFWLPEGGPLDSPANGGAHLVVVDDPQMPNLVAIAKHSDPKRPVIYRSHIQIRSDLVDEQPDSATAHVFHWLHSFAQKADMFIAHPVKEFVPKAVDPSRIAYLPATTDWLDGLNKDLPQVDSEYFLHEYNLRCLGNGQPQLAFPERDYIIQIARFDPSKGIPTVIEGYAQLRRTYMRKAPVHRIPQLVIAGHGAIDDPDFAKILDETSRLLDEHYSDIKSDISVMRLGPIDQLLNALMSNAKIALQLSTREGFEVKVSEALHKGIPIVATRAGGIPLQVEDGKSGFIVEPGDAAAVAKRLHQLLTNDELYSRMSEYARTHVSDEVSTVGNALSWLYLADALTTSEEKVKPNGRWINDMARETAGLPYVDGEVRLPRHLST